MTLLRDNSLLINIRPINCKPMDGKIVDKRILKVGSALNIIHMVSYFED